LAGAGGLADRLEREFFIDNLLVRIHLIIVMIRWTGLAPWEFEFPFPGSRTLCASRHQAAAETPGLQGYLAHKNPPPVGPYSSPMPEDLRWS